MRQSVILTHNVEMGHRLSMQPNSKCFQLHGHSWWVELELEGDVKDDGMVVEFGHVKKLWREYLDTTFDHHLCLNSKDPFMEVMAIVAEIGEVTQEYEKILTEWGVTTIGQQDPTVENMAALWGNHALNLFREDVSRLVVSIKVREASTNAATWSSR